MKTKLANWIILLLLTALFLPVSAAANQNGIVVGLVAADSEKITAERWQPLLNGLSKKIGMPVKGVFLGDYAGIIWYLASGKAQVAWVGNKAAIEAVDRANCEIVARIVNTQSGTGYYSHLIADSKSPLNNEQDVLNNAGKLIFGNGDPNSTSGFVVPGYYLFASRKLDPGMIFKRVINNNHEGNFHAVVSGQVDVATSNSMAIVRYKTHFPEKSKQVKVIWTSPLIPTDPIVIRKELPPKIRMQITDFFVQYGKEAEGKNPDQVASEREILAFRDWAGFAQSDNSQLTPIRKLELFKKRIRIQRDDTIPVQDKILKLELIDKQLKQLDS